MVHNGSVFVFVLYVFWQFVVGILAIHQQCFGKSFAAVGADLSCPHICIRHAFAIRWDTFGNPSAALSQSVRSRREPIYRAHIYVFATHSQSVGTHLAIRQQHYRNPFRIHSRNVRNVFVICVLHIRHAKVWFLRHKSMVFGVQKPPFYIAKTPFLACKKWVFAKP